MYIICGGCSQKGIVLCDSQGSAGFRFRDQLPMVPVDDKPRQPRPQIHEQESSILYGDTMVPNIE